MRELYELKGRLIDELKEYGGKELSSNTLGIIDTLAHATKNLCKVIESCEEEHSHYSPYEQSYRHRDSLGRYARDYSREMYARDGALKEELRMLANDTRDERVKQEIMKLVSRLDVG